MTADDLQETPLKRARQNTQQLDPIEYAKKWSTLLDTNAHGHTHRSISHLPSGRPMDEYLEALRTDGCLIIQNVISKDKVMAFKQEHDRILEILHPTLERLERGEEGNAQEAADNFYQGAASVRGLRVQKMARGRFQLKSVDHRDGGALVKDTSPENSCLADLTNDLILPDLVKQILEHVMPMPWRMSSCGTLPALPGAEAGSWHRDINLMFGDEALDLSLPDFYFNLLVPLEPVSSENGTEMLLGSHKLLQKEVGQCPRGVVQGEPGDVFIFNGKIVHRGKPNQAQTAVMRSLLYVVFSARWFEQGREKDVSKWISEKPYDD